MQTKADIEAQRKNALRTAKFLFLLVAIIIVTYFFWYKTYNANVMREQERLKGNNLTKIQQSKTKVETGEVKNERSGKK